MEKSNLFFTYLGNLKLQKEEDQKRAEINKEESVDKSNETTKIDNEWFQEYEVIYQSYSIG